MSVNGARLSTSSSPNRFFSLAEGKNVGATFLLRSSVKKLIKLSHGHRTESTWCMRLMNHFLSESISCHLGKGHMEYTHFTVRLTSHSQDGDYTTLTTLSIPTHPRRRSVCAETTKKGRHNCECVAHVQNIGKVSIPCNRDKVFQDRVPSSSILNHRRNKRFLRQRHEKNEKKRRGR